jgi:hypothetical protein
MNIVERIKLRETLLKELYDNYFAQGGKENKIIFKAQEVEKRLALYYLADKKVIFCRLIKEDHQQEFMVKITVTGIDAVENNMMEIDKIEMEKERPNTKTITESPKKKAKANRSAGCIRRI